MVAIEGSWTDLGKVQRSSADLVWGSPAQADLAKPFTGVSGAFRNFIWGASHPRTYSTYRAALGQRSPRAHRKHAACTHRKHAACISFSPRNTDPRWWRHACRCFRSGCSSPIQALSSSPAPPPSPPPSGFGLAPSSSPTPRRELPQRRYPLVRTPRDEGREPGELVMNLLPGRTMRGGADGRCRVGCAGAWGWRGGVEGGAGRGGAGTGRVRGRTCDTWNPDGYMTVA